MGNAINFDKKMDKYLIKYMYEYVFTDNQKKGMTVNSVRKHIKQAYGNSNKYMNYLWRRVV